MELIEEGFVGFLDSNPEVEGHKDITAAYNAFMDAFAMETKQNLKQYKRDFFEGYRA